MGLTAIFDMDGTILYTLEDIVLGLNYALRAHGYPEKTTEEIRSFVGNGILNEVRCSLPEGTDEESMTAVYDTFNKWYALHCMDHTRPYDGILDLLTDLKAAGVRLAVVSNKGDYAVQELNQSIFRGLFDVSLGEKPGIQRKPAPDMVYEVMREMNVSSAVYIGDSEVDAETAENAGIPCILVSWGYRDMKVLEKLKCDCIVRSVEELKAELLKYSD